MNQTLPKAPSQRLAEIFYLLLTGGVLYYGLEIAFRGYSHRTMALCGGICFYALYRINQTLLSLSLPLRALLGALVICSAELLFGCICNLWLGWEIWSYRHLPFNLWGQICLPFFLLWFLLCFPAALLCRLIRRRVFLQNE